ncbi:insulinase family protein [Bacteroidales bacterium OttesenSCG-928-K03]|nr:insulinase family protein [Bacteroidales bacterium OttesenSCG-928-L14]MDL2241040.1 insulinase family protein [Bacteroidales bacterium OttesenSCG-928-K22]MDL2242674.1 insulinase family protein [Bacteroidales bacterium OttesenSCG-928-K03]
MKSFPKLSIFLFILVIAFSCTNKYPYETVKNDPLNTRIYTLDNGLKVYMSVNDEQPRIQTYITVKVGGKNDPAETTGLAHYFEHLMFKGTEQFGTQNYEAEKPLLDEIERLFEVYRNTTDENERAAIYKVIDSISNEASKLSIPNEYDKLMAAIGASGTNAWTSFDATSYTEDIPSNQIENWAKIQSDRFKHNVIRGFHTELETVYEEKNMSLTQDNRKVSETLLASLFPNHPYGKQTVLGTQEHLKNPSIINIKNYYKTYYVPNNMAICLAGDFNPDEMIEIIDKYFGDMQPNKDLPKLQFPQEKPIEQPIIKEVLGLDAESINIAWRTGGATSEDADIVELIGSLLSNGKAGLIDVDLRQTQKVLSARASGNCMADYGYVNLSATPKKGQSLDEVKELLLAEIAKLRNGEFDENLISSIIANWKLNNQRQYDSNAGRAMTYVYSFLNGVEWKDEVEHIDRVSKITKQDIVDFANKNLNDNNYVAIYKREGKDPNEQKIAKPQITPIATNRDETSTFFEEIKNCQVKPIAPVFLDFKKDLNITKDKNNMEVLYKHNKTTDLFQLYFRYEFGKYEVKEMGLATSYTRFLGSSKMNLEELNKAFYNIACSFNLSVSANESSIMISGLNENMPQALQLFGNFINDIQPNEEALENMKIDLHKSRANSKLNQNNNYSALRNYAIYGEDFIEATTLTDNDINSATSEQLLKVIEDWLGYEYTVLYYGPSTEHELLTIINDNSFTKENLVATPKQIKYYPLQTKGNSTLLAEYDANQIRYAQISNNGEKYDLSKEPIISLYREYFGGGMNAIVFQEMREARGLAYSSNATVMFPSDPDGTYTFQAFIATQNDKFNDAMDAFDEIINNMPVSESAFDIAKQGLLTNYETQRVTKANVLWNYISAKEFNLDFDRREYYYNNIKKLSLDDVVKYQQENIKDRDYTYCILGRQSDLNLDKLKALGPIKTLSKEEIYGY